MMTMDTELDQENIPSEDFVYSFAALPGLEKCLAACASGLYSSVDGGRTWQDAFESLHLPEALTTTSAVFSPDFSNDHTLFAGVPGSVLRSLDGGKTWQAATFPTPPPAVSCLAISPNFAADGILFAGTMEDGVFYTSDRGTTWVSWNFGLLDLNILCLAASPNFARDETLFVGTSSGLFRSTNGGRAWREVELPSGLDPVISLAISPGFEKDGILLAGTETGLLCLSRDGGASWTTVRVADEETPLNSIFIPADPGAQQALTLAGAQPLISADGGQSWQPLALDLSAEAEVTALIAPAGLASGSPLLVGLLGGEILRVEVP